MLIGWMSQGFFKHTPGSWQHSPLVKLWPGLAPEAEHPQLYEVHYVAQGSMQIDALLGEGSEQRLSQQQLTLNFNGLLEKTPWQEGVDHWYVVQLQVKDLELKQGDQALTEAVSRLKQDWQQPFLIEEDEQGLLKELHPPAQWQPMSQESALTLMQTLQMQPPEDAAEVWATHEENNLGSIAFTYAAESTPHGWTVRKVPGTVDAKANVADGAYTWKDLDVEWRAKGETRGLWLPKEKSWQTLTVEYLYEGLRGPTLVGTDEHRLTLQAITGPKLLDDAEARKLGELLHQPGVRKQRRLAAATAEKSWLAQQLKGRSLEDVGQDLQAFSKDPQSWDQEKQRILFQQIRATLQLKAHAAKDWHRVLTAAPVAREAYNLTLQALEITHDPAAQDLLRDLVKSEELNQNQREDALIVLARSQLPDQETEALFRELSQSSNPGFKDVAQLGLGILASKLQSSHDQGDQSKRVDGLLEDMQENLQKAESVDDKKRALAALGNSGSPLVIEAMEKALQDPDPRMREEAILGLRLIDDPKARQLLWNIVRDPSQQDLQKAAGDALVFRPRFPDEVQTSIETLKTTRSDEIRVCLAQILSAGYRFNPNAVRENLEALTRSPSPNLSGLARSMLLGLPKT